MLNFIAKFAAIGYEGAVPMKGEDVDHDVKNKWYWLDAPTPRGATEVEFQRKGARR